MFPRKVRMERRGGGYPESDRNLCGSLLLSGCRPMGNFMILWFQDRKTGCEWMVLGVGWWEPQADRLRVLEYYMHII